MEETSILRVGVWSSIFMTMKFIVVFQTEFIKLFGGDITPPQHFATTRDSVPGGGVDAQFPAQHPVTRVGTVSNQDPDAQDPGTFKRGLLGAPKAKHALGEERTQLRF
ncbi:hypothetical protein TIFTF001_014498 [Ficus carica]|uniref:Uncharacterized protein n=1 Tax=Ficus carica TaxID=3494 RepID=A0AA88DIG6_FICCA|nr:hypothetical protein TIFTF001_014498 [Ficus carica]